MERRFRYFVLLVILLGVMVSVSLYLVVNRSHQAQLSNSFQDQLERVAVVVEDRWNVLPPAKDEELLYRAQQIVLPAIDDFRLNEVSICLLIRNIEGKVCNFELTDVQEVQGFPYVVDVSLQGDADALLRAAPLPFYLEEHQRWEPLLILIVSLFLTALVAIYMAFTYHRAGEVRALIVQRTRELNEANRKLELLSLTDSLTGVVNRRGFDEALANEWGRAIRTQHSLTLLLIDVDHFKAFNDHYGHLAGDECLQRVAQILSDVPGRLGDLVARYGGEEFAVLLPNTEDLSGAVAERCRSAVEYLNIPHANSTAADCVTISVGSVSLKPHLHEAPDTILGLADEALYAAKAGGRNRIETTVAAVREQPSGHGEHSAESGPNSAQMTSPAEPNTS